MIAPRAAFKVTLDGVDLTDRLSPRLLSLSLSEKRGGEADQLDLVLHDHDGKLAIPKEGALLRVSIGWERGTGVIVGLVDKGSFKVDEAEHSGPPDIITVRARSADLTAGYRRRRDKSYVGKTIGAIVREVAARHGLQAQVDPDLAAIAVPAVGQSARSDMALVRQLGRRYDATATVKAGKLIFAPIGKGATATGKPIPAAAIARSDNDRHSFRRVSRSTYDGAEASWHDQDSAEKKTERAGGSSNPKRLRRTYASQAEAKAAAAAEARRIKRGAAELELNLALGRPDLYPERRLSVGGFKAEIDAIAWLVSEAEHRMDGQGGLRTALKLEIAG